MRPAQRKAVDYMQSSHTGKDSTSLPPLLAPQEDLWHGPLLLDTHVLLDLWVFRDPRVEPLARRLPHLDWVATTAMLAEWTHVLARGRIPGCPPGTPSSPLPWQPRLVAEVPRAPWRCRDADDQMFLDTAYALRPAWLWSRDRALLAHRRRARALGVTIETPESGLQRLGWD
jgi:hypothetical protein